MHVCTCVRACVHVCARMCTCVGTASRYTPIVWTCVHKCSYARAHVHSHLGCHLELLWLVRAWPDRERGQPGSPSALPLILYVALGESPWGLSAHLQSSDFDAHVASQEPEEPQNPRPAGRGAGATQDQRRAPGRLTRSGSSKCLSCL